MKVDDVSIPTSAFSLQTDIRPIEVKTLQVARKGKPAAISHNHEIFIETDDSTRQVLCVPIASKRIGYSNGHMPVRAPAGIPCQSPCRIETIEFAKACDELLPAIVEELDILMTKDHVPTTGVGDQAIQTGIGIEIIAFDIVDKQVLDVIAVKAATTKGAAHVSIERPVGDQRADTEKELSRP